MRAVGSISMIVLLFLLTISNTNANAGPQTTIDSLVPPRVNHKRNEGLSSSRKSETSSGYEYEDEDEDDVDREQKIAEYRDRINTTSIQNPPTYDVDWLLNVFQEVLVPKRESYRKLVTYYSLPPSALSSPQTSSTTSRSSSTNSQTSSIPSDFDEKTEEIRKYLKLKLSPERAKETYRFTEVDAETAFITRYYGFINPDYNRNWITGLVQIVEDKLKTLYKLALYNGPNKFDEFPTWSEEEKQKFCSIYINYSFVLRKENIYFDRSKTCDINMIKVSVRYRHELLKRHIDTAKIVLCPCWSNDKKFFMGVLPVSYQSNASQYNAEEYKFNERYAFIYHDVKQSEYGTFVRVLALTRIDQETLRKDLKKEKIEIEKAEAEETKKRQKRENGKQSPLRQKFTDVFHLRKDEK